MLLAISKAKLHEARLALNPDPMELVQHEQRMAKHLLQSNTLCKDYSNQTVTRGSAPKSSISAHLYAANKCLKSEVRAAVLIVYKYDSSVPVGKNIETSNLKSSRSTASQALCLVLLFRGGSLTSAYEPCQSIQH